MKLKTITGKEFFCSEIVVKENKTYYRDGYILWSQDKIIEGLKKRKPKKKHDLDNDGDIDQDDFKLASQTLNIAKHVNRKP